MSSASHRGPRSFSRRRSSPCTTRPPGEHQARAPTTCSVRGTTPSKVVRTPTALGLSIVNKSQSIRQTDKPTNLSSNSASTFTTAESRHTSTTLEPPPLPPGRPLPLAAASSSSLLMRSSSPSRSALTLTSISPHARQDSLHHPKHPFPQPLAINHSGREHGATACAVFGLSSASMRISVSTGSGWEGHFSSSLDISSTSSVRLALSSLICLFPSSSLFLCRCRLERHSLVRGRVC